MAEKCEGKGLIQNYKGMDYLGHFRNPKVMHEGHNQGPPGEPLGILSKKERKGMDPAALKARRMERKGERKEAFKSISAQRQLVRDLPKGAERKAARTELKSEKASAKKEFPQAYKARIAPKPKEESGGGIFGKIKKAFGGDKMGGMAKKVGGAAKKVAKPF